MVPAQRRMNEIIDFLSLANKIKPDVQQQTNICLPSDRQPYIYMHGLTLQHIKTPGSDHTSVSESHPNPPDAVVAQNKSVGDIQELEHANAD